MSQPPSQAKRANSRVMQQAKSGTARAALLGASDGLVTNISLILGVAGAGAGPQVIQVAGFASLIAGALSMAVGEYISMRGQVELLSGILKLEREQLHSNPDEVHTALHEILEADGVAAKTAHRASLEVAADPEKAMAMYARGKLGINPEELGSVWGSAGSSLVMFSIGAFVPLLPWLLTSGPTAIWLSIGLSAIGALAIGSYLAYTAGSRMLHSALRQLLVLIIAASATYLIGRLFGTQIS
ncbi:MAG TPA: VIT1/CCC1 transporter family protein [Candidatus Saccharimonadia bacterium]|nr:VIT1/CCC1 transporter family protein [Candidatus Saccharimonadia bacterium]